MESSITSMVTAYFPAVVGVPDNTPLLLTELPGGNPVPTHRYGVRPPAAASVCEYAEPTFPDATEAVVMATGGALPMAWLDAAGHSMSEPGNSDHSS